MTLPYPGATGPFGGNVDPSAPRPNWDSGQGRISNIFDYLNRSRLASGRPVSSFPDPQRDLLPSTQPPIPYVSTQDLARAYIASRPQGTQPPLPGQGKLDVMNPGPWLAEMLRGQRPGYVLNSRVPRPNQWSQYAYNRATPTQRSIYDAYLSALGIAPEDALQEMIRYWYGHRPYQSVRHLA